MSKSAEDYIKYLPFEDDKVTFNKMALVNLLESYASQPEGREETGLHYFREGYKYYRSFDKHNTMPYDEAAEITVQKGFNALPPSKEQPAGREELLKQLLRNADCPEFLIENPGMFNGAPSAKTVEWARRVIKKYKSTQNK